MRGLVRSTGKFKKHSFKNNSHRVKLPLHDWKACEQARSFCLGLFLVYNLIDGVGGGGARLHFYHSLLFFFQSCTSNPSFPLAAGAKWAHASSTLTPKPPWLWGRQTKKFHHYFCPGFLWSSLTAEAGGKVTATQRYCLCMLLALCYPQEL